MAGCGDKKIYQWDSDTGDLVQVSSEAFSCCGLLLISCWPLALPSVLLPGHLISCSAVLHDTGGRA